MPPERRLISKNRTSPGKLQNILMKKPPRPKLPINTVLDWLHAVHPELHPRAVIDRHWVWLAVDLRGDHNKPVRESIKAYGFIFAAKGHTLPDGQTGTWAHHCEHAIAFKPKLKGMVRAKGKGQPNRNHNQTAERVDPLAATTNIDDSDREALDFIGAA